MRIADEMLSRAGAQFRKIDKRTATISSGLLALWLFSDTLLPLIGEGLHLLIEVVELAFEHLLEWAFGLSRRTAQMVTFWTGFLLISYALFRLVRRIIAELRHARDALARRMRHWNTEQRAAWVSHPYARLTLTVGAIGATVYLLA